MKPNWNKNRLFAVCLLVVMMVSFISVPQPAAALSTCNAAQFVADVTVPDDTIYAAGATFSKTWRIMNVGTCTWSTSYTLVYVDGTQMGAPATTSLPASVAPGNTVDLTVALTAPGSAGTYRGNFQLKDAGGVMFGIGSTADKSFWVEIVVSGTPGSSTGYDFVANAGSATWTSGAGSLLFPGAEGNDNGFAYTIAAPHLENGTTDSAPGLLTVPQRVYNGYIQGQYPVYHVQNGDHFQSIVNCEYNATSCFVNFRLNYQIGSGPVQTFWSYSERYDGLFYRANFDLSALAGQDVKFILYIGSAGYADGDRALWGAPRITNGGLVVPPPPPPVTPPPPPSVDCDHATFISDINVPDGTVFAPNTAFTKTWRIKNIGTCTWTTSYQLVFVSGNQMGGSSPTNLTSTVGPNTSFNISVPLTSPATSGSYRGYWQLKNASGNLFGIGYHADKAWWVDIAVSASAPTSTPVTPGTPVPSPTPTSTPSSTATPITGGFDFTAHPELAEWKNGSGALLTFGSTSGDAGYAYKLASVQLEDGVTYNSNPSLMMVPQNITDGLIQGTYPSYTVQSGDRFKARIGCRSGYPDCNVKFWLYFRASGGTLYTIADYGEKFDTPVGLTRAIDIPLTSLVGQTGNFILAIGTNGSPTGDQAPWVYPRIEH